MLRPRTPRPTLPPDVPLRFLSRLDLLAGGARPREITTAVRAGDLLRPRRGRYLPHDCHPTVITAVRAGGRVDCLSLLALLGVFVERPSPPHVQVDPDASRLPTAPDGVTRHWRATTAAEDAVITPLVEALAASVRCQAPRAALATMDSAWHLGLVDETGVAQVFALLPRRYRRLRPLLDPRAEAGTESLVRLMLRGLGCGFDLQVEIDGVGFVDILVEGWLIVECDSEKHHGGWQDHKRDRRRDAAAVALGYVPLRFIAEDILFHPERVLATLRAALAHGPRR